MRIALFEPDIPQNTGNILRLGACLGIEIDIIEPTPQTVEALMKLDLASGVDVEIKI